MVRKKLDQSSGFTLPEVLVTVSVVGILAAIPAIQLQFNNTLRDGTDQVAGIFKQARMRAMATTSAYRIMTDSQAPNSRLKVERAKTRGCDATTQLTAGAIASDTQLTVGTTKGFMVGDRITVGTDSTDNNIVATSTFAITLGQALGTTQPNGTPVELVNAWENDLNFSNEELTLGKDLEIQANATNWIICFDSRGIASLYDATGTVNLPLKLTLRNLANNQGNEINIFKGGAIEIKQVQN